MLLRAVGFDPKKAPTIVLPDVETMSEGGNSELGSGQEPIGSPQATAVRYTQPEAVEAGKTSSECQPDLTNPFTSLPTLTTTRALHVPIDDAQVGWPDCFLIYMGILMMSAQNTSSVGLARMPQSCTCAPGDVLPLLTT